MKEIKRGQLIQLFEEYETEVDEANRRVTTFLKKSHASDRPPKTYHKVKEDIGNESLADALVKVGKAKDAVEAKKMQYKMRNEVQSLNKDPLQVLADYGLMNFSKRYRGGPENRVLSDEENLMKTRQLFVKILTTPPELHKEKPGWFNEFDLQKRTPKSNYFRLNPTQQKGAEFVAILMTCDDLEEFKRNNEEAIRKVYSKYGDKVGFTKCYQERGAEKGDPKLVSKAPQGQKIDFEGYSHGQLFWKFLIDKNIVNNKEEAQNYIQELRGLAQQGYDIDEVLYERGVLKSVGLLGRPERLTTMQRKEILGDFEKETGVGGEMSLSEKLSRKLNAQLRKYFGIIAQDNQDPRLITFPTAESKTYASIFNERSIPPILLASKFINRYQGQLTNEKLGINGLSYNSYNTAYDFLEQVVERAQGKDTGNSAYYMARQFNKINPNWEEDRPNILNYKGETELYKLDKSGYKEANLNVTLRTDWSILGEMKGNTFEWTFNIKVKYGAKEEEDKRILYGLLPVEFVSEEDNDRMVVKHNPRENEVYKGLENNVVVQLDEFLVLNRDMTILDNKEVLNGLKDCVKGMMMKINRVDKFSAVVFVDVVNETERMVYNILKEIKGNHKTN
jgi:hypothetical protein